MSSATAPVPTVSWREDGTPFSPRFDDVYRSAGLDGHGGLEQARGVFLRGCGLLPENGAAAAWANAPRWAILETGFGLGLNFLAAWHAWRQDPARPERLFYTSVEAYPPEPSDLLRSATAFPELAELSRQLGAQWHGLVRGFHRLCFEREGVVLTLIVDDIAPALKELAGRCDSVFLDGFSPARNPAMWSAATFGAIARHAHAGTRAATWCVAHEVRERLAQSGFQTERVPGVPPKRHALRARFSPTKTEGARTEIRPARCIVVGGGLAGACAAWSLAERGWQVTILDCARHPAAGASAVPAGIFAPHVSADDCPLSQLTRAGIAATQARAARLLRPGIDFSSDGVLELHLPGKRRLPAWWDGADLPSAVAPESHDSRHAATRAKARAARVELSAHRPALWHAQAGWMRPAALVEASLNHPDVTWRGNAHVAHVLPEDGLWRLVDKDDRTLDQAELVVIAAGFETQALLPDGGLPLRALRGQIAWGSWPAGADRSALPPFPVNGQGYLIGHLPGTAAPDTPYWVLGSTFERSGLQSVQRASAHAANWSHLNALLPDSARVLATAWRRGDAHAWAGVRATLPDHLPAVGPWIDQTARELRGTVAPLEPNSSLREMAAAGAADRLPIQLCTALGARGLTLAVLCGEVLAARLHDEPLPIARSLATHLRASRYAPRDVRRGRG